MSKNIKKTDLDFIYDGNLRVTGYQHDTHTLFNTDIPQDFGGRGLYSAPSDLFAASLASSILTHLGRKAEEMNIPLQGITIRITKEIEYTKQIQVKSLKVELSCPRPIESKFEKEIETIAQQSPIATTLAPSFPIHYIFNWYKGDL